MHGAVSPASGPPTHPHVHPTTHTHPKAPASLPRLAAPYARQLLLEGSSLQDAQMAKIKRDLTKGLANQVGGQRVDGQLRIAGCNALHGLRTAGAMLSMACGLLHDCPPQLPTCPV